MASLMFNANNAVNGFTLIAYLKKIILGLISKMEWKNIIIKCPNKNTGFVYHHFAPTNKKSSYNDSHSIFNYKNTTSPSHISLKQEISLKAKNIEAICDNYDYDGSVYQTKNLQSTANKVCFPKNGAKHEIESKPLKNQNCIQFCK